MAKQIPAGRNSFALVDDGDYERFACQRWHLCKGYARRGPVGDSPAAFMHREILGLTPGDGSHVDHVNGNRLDNRRRNLRTVTQAQNNQNRLPNSTSQSSYRGVTWRKERSRWQASVRVGGRLHKLGDFADELDAALAAARFRQEVFPYSTEPLLEGLDV